ncbi:AAA family ATPase [Rhodococcus koreensis]|uniref:AAA family ATPase n=1 Tax=Rhodococcus koreensis TaxID=99653 RepID=UPI00198260B5|nr:AAA family ATPase [Rhodococcus koreensis]QSE77691.1 AAA family ATPase [Rhodococcus koreensis]
MSSPPNYTPLLAGIGFAGYRSFAAWQNFSFPTKVTVLAGINNSGKSNVLRFLQEVMPVLRTGAHGGRAPKKPELGVLDSPRGFDGVVPLEVGVAIPLGSRGDRQNVHRTTGTAAGSPRPNNLEGFQEYLMALLAVDDLYWSRFTLVDQIFEPTPDQVEKAVALWPLWKERHAQHAHRALGSGSTDPLLGMRRLAESIGGFEAMALPKVVTISGARRVEDSGDDNHDRLSGRGIIQELAALQNPQHEQWEDSRSKWAAINRFVQTVLGDPEASLNIPHDRSTIQVATPQRVLPLTSLGSGVEQVIVLAAAATATTKSLVCVEEPETNLHPLLQKKLVRYRVEETNNQYVIATHSSHLLDDSRATAYHVRLTTGGTVARLARRPHELIQICNDLGYRPSDLLQANCVVWVEGPSDRIYVRRWIELIDPSLAEGIEYSIMFYGGKLLSHLGTSEEALDEFISLRRLNRASAVVIDSDKTSADAPINTTKQRIQAEFEADDPAPGFAWVTDCYTVENYLAPVVLKDAVDKQHPGTSYTSVGRWKNPLPSSKDKTKFDKIAIARTASAMITVQHLDRFDLAERVSRLVEFIRSANGHSVAPEPTSSAADLR